MIEIPEKIRIANGIIFDHEYGEYHMHHPSGMFMNIPNNAEICKETSDMEAQRFVTIRVPENKVIITLYTNRPPHITVC